MALSYHVIFLYISVVGSEQAVIKTLENVSEVFVVF